MPRAARLRVLQQQIVGGESANDQQAVMKRRKQNEEVQRRRKEIAAAIGRSVAEDEDDDEILVKAYDDVQSTLRARTELAKKMKGRVSGRAARVGWVGCAAAQAVAAVQYAGDSCEVWFGAVEGRGCGVGRYRLLPTYFLLIQLRDVLPSLLGSWI